MWLCANKTLLTNQAVGQVWPADWPALEDSHAALGWACPSGQFPYLQGNRAILPVIYTGDTVKQLEFDTW